MTLRTILIMAVLCTNWCVNSQEASIYIFTRATQLKSPFIATDFNLEDKKSSHLGIGYQVEKSFVIYHVINDRGIDNTALLINDLNSFISPSGIEYHSIWKAKVSKTEFQLFLAALSKHENQVIHFDHDFDISYDTTLYCSEFVYKILMCTNPNRFVFEPTLRQLSTFYASLLKRSELHYIPVDFFRKLNVFQLVEEKNYEIDSEVIRF